VRARSSASARRRHRAARRAHAPCHPEGARSMGVARSRRRRVGGRVGAERLARQARCRPAQAGDGEWSEGCTRTAEAWDGAGLCEFERLAVADRGFELQHAHRMRKSCVRTPRACVVDYLWQECSSTADAAWRRMRMPASSSPPRLSDSAPARHRLRALALEPFALGLSPGRPPSRARAIVAAPEGRARAPPRASTHRRASTRRRGRRASSSSRCCTVDTGWRALHAVPIGARGSRCKRCPRSAGSRSAAPTHRTIATGATTGGRKRGSAE
jgi:hypothetical protein